MTKDIIKVETKAVEKAPKPLAKFAIGTLNILVVPAKKRFHKFYHPQKNQHWLWHVIIDGLLIVALILISAVSVYIWLNPPRYSADLPGFLATAFYQPKLAIDLKTGEALVSGGDKQTYRIKIKNVSRVPAKDVTVNLYLDSELYSGEKRIYFTAEQVPALAELKPGAELELNYTFILNTDFVQQTADQKQLVVASYAEALFRSPDNLKEQSVLTGKLIQKVRSDIKLEAFSRYQSAEGEQLGVGPNPPVAGSPTRYWIFFTASTNYNDAKDIIVTGYLPENVRFTGRTSALSEEGVSYNPNNRQVTWRVDRVAAPASFYPVVGASFEVEIIPWYSQVDTSANLIDHIKLTATDVFTAEKIEKTLEVVTTATAENPEGGRIKK